MNLFSRRLHVLLPDTFVSSDLRNYKMYVESIVRILRNRTEFNENRANTRENNGISRNDYDLDRYDFYFEKIRGLLLPSLEHRIHSCLETFVYREDAGPFFESPYLKRCLDVAAAWRDLVDAFSIKWGDEKFLENMLGQAVKYLIKDGLVDCFLNSIILNNRINKICRDLDALGPDRDLPRYLTVWNYINERDYWIENGRISRSTSHHDLIDRRSDLDVEIGSKVYDCRKDNESNRALKRRATEDSSENPRKKNDEPADDLETIDRLAPENWLCVDSSIPKESKSSNKRRTRTIRKTFSCTPSTCSTYIIKKNQLEGNILKLKIFQSWSATSICESPRVMEKSKLHLPCKSNDLMSKIIKSYASLLGSSTIVGRKRLQASIINICRRINEILGKMDVNEIRNCRLDCELFRERVNFRLAGREANGCKVCLLVDRVVINKTDAKSRSASRESSVGRLARIAENDNSQESGLTIYESARFDLLDDDPKIIADSEAIVKVEKDSNVLDFSEDSLEPTKLNLPKESTHNNFSNEIDFEDQACRCGALGFPVLDHEDSNQKVDPMPESTGKSSPTYSDKNIPEDQEHPCNPPPEEITDHIDHDMKKVEENPHLSILDSRSNNENRLIRKKSSINLFDDMIKGEETLADHSVEVTQDHDDQKEENSRNELIEECLCDCSLIKLLDPSEHDSGNSAKSMECLDKIVKSDPETQGQESIDEVVASNSRESKEQQNEEIRDSPIENTSPPDHEVLKPDGNDRSIEGDVILCECPSDCLCINKKTPNEDAADCDSQCSCDSCTDLNPKESLEDPFEPSNNSTVIAGTFSKMEDPPLSQRSAVISARLPNSKPQKINISIELCSESESSLKKDDNNEKKNTSMVHGGSKNFERPGPVVTKISSSLGRSGAISVDRGNCKEHVNSQWEENAKCQSSGGSRIHSPPRPLESRDYVPCLKRPSRMRNRNAYAFSSKSGGHSYDKFERRRTTRRVVKNYDTNQCCESIKNRRCFDQIKRDKVQSDCKKKSEELSCGPGKSPKFAHLFHGFSASSLDRMRHLIKTKLRRILLERDKSTNTPKTTCANRKYRCNVLEKKIESSTFAQTRCRTIWESHSATDSTRTSRSFVSSDRNFRSKIPDSDEITKVLYSSAIGPRISYSNYSNNSVDIRDSRQPVKNGRIKNYPRLAGGGEFVAPKKRLGRKKSSCTRQKRYDFVTKSTKKEIRRLSYSQIGKSREKIVNRKVCDSETLREINENDLTPRSVKLDSTGNSTSRYICLYEFAQFEDRSNEINKNSHDCKKSRLSRRPIETLRCVDALKNSSSNTDTINYRRKGFTHLDDDLRTKLSQYVSLCKNVKYSLLKRLRLGDVYEVSATSITRCDRYKFEVS